MDEYSHIALFYLEVIIIHALVPMLLKLISIYKQYSTASLHKFKYFKPNDIKNVSFPDVVPNLVLVGRIHW